MGNGVVQYWLDADVLIQAKNGPYAFDIAPEFWKWLEEQLRSGRVVVSKVVYGELMDGDDELSEWIHQFRDEPCIVEPDEEAQRAYTEIADYVNGKHPNHHVQMFLKGADGWVIAQARTQKGIVVTHESEVVDSSRKIKIPNVCKQFGVEFRSLYAMMRELGAKI